MQSVVSFLHNAKLKKKEKQSSEKNLRTRGELHFYSRTMSHAPWTVTIFHTFFHSLIITYSLHFSTPVRTEVAELAGEKTLNM